jgi:hypothetical protein
MATPARAPPHTTDRMTVALPASSRSAENGVYVPAMKMKIMEWSRRRMSWNPRGVQTRRW